MSLPPLCMRSDDPAAADPARRRLLQTSRFPRFPSLPHSRLSLPPLPQPDNPPNNDILLDDAHLPVIPHDKDVFRWAILYENQRGITLFSTPFYSALSLLPSDPHPFTFPQSYSHHPNNPNLSLNNYPLPDGTWRWLSTAWMIDMRSDLGEVQYDGFEYNWFFRDNHWHATVGKLSAGAWVRRRRWVRLMMRPANHIHAANPTTNSNLSITPPLVEFPFHLWDGGDQDWDHVQRLLRQLGRDGRKLELWQMWLAQTRLSGKQSDPPSSPSQKVLEHRLSGVLPEGNPPPLVHLIAILRNHGEAILHSFVFPDSRAQFVSLVKLAGRSHDLESGLGRAPSAADVDFWSYAANLSDTL